MAPGDESALDVSFGNFLTVLRGVARERNAAELQSLCVPDVTLLRARQNW